jgi:hypothetical protein
MVTLIHTHVSPRWVVRVGYLNDKIEERKDFFCEIFDVVLTPTEDGDPGLEYPISVVEHLGAPTL